MKYITHLIFSGNALKSMTLCGVLRYLYFYNLDRNIHDVAATSMGAFFALAFALKIPIEKLEKMILEATYDDKLTKFSPSAFMNIINEYGISCSKDYLNTYRKYLKEIYDQDDITFLELSKKTGVNIYISTTRVDTGTNVIFNVNDTPNISVLDAIAASMCIPMLSKPIIIDDLYYIDGFLTNNFPCEMFSHINKNNILAIASDVSNSYVMTPLEKGNKLSIYEYYYNIIFIYQINNYKLCYLNKLKEFDDVLIIKTNSSKNLFIYNREENCLDFSLKENELNNLYLIGYKAINDYMNSKNEIV
jgi:predicted acylesterase/phospholipase RssA